jgi:stress-induced-phosphoprotein 1
LHSAVTEAYVSINQEKEEGNAAYKQKDFDSAVAHYNKAIELYDKDISFITNRAAVHFECKDYDAAIKDCELAVERGRELRADFKMLAK